MARYKAIDTSPQFLAETDIENRGRNQPKPRIDHDFAFESIETVVCPLLSPPIANSGGERGATGECGVLVLRRVV